MDDIRDMIAAQRSELAVVLAGLPAPRWDEPTLCAGWRVREMVAHITMPFRYSRRRFALELARSRGRFNDMADRCARRDAAAMSAADLTQALRSNADHPWRPPGGGFEGALTHDVIHGLDITEALRLGLRVPDDRLRVVLPNLVRPQGLKFFGVDLAGTELRASDLDWTYGSGTLLTRTAQDLALLLCARTRLPSAPPGH
ncbi:MAG: maleylpyruvate isomerase family mycothiol-dependent enzyme [Actinomycetota bacterium]|nr:maleylpyruvate isomerase family mycothiol-dependent enzyme [Actinomycetota bacterium]